MIYTDGHNCDIVSGLIIGHFSQYLKELQAIKCITNDCFTMVKWSKENIKKQLQRYSKLYISDGQHFHQFQQSE